MSDAIAVNQGGTISFTGTWADEAGVPMDLSGCTLAVQDASHDVIEAEATVTIVSATSGAFRFRLPASASADLPFGRNSSFRLALITAAGDVEPTPRIWINVQ